VTEITLIKKCRGCKLPKLCSPIAADSAFYCVSGVTNPTRLGHYLSECKDCMKARSVVSNRLPKAESRVLSENLAIEKLKREGIWAQTGKGSSAPDVDVTAWGCVWIEVKLARLLTHRGNQSFKFTTTPKQQQRGFLADIVMLICQWNERLFTYHLFAADDQIFYTKNRIKTGFTYTPLRKYSIGKERIQTPLTKEMMNSAQNCFELIENVRLRHAQEIVTTPFPHRRWREKALAG